MTERNQLATDGPIVEGLDPGLAALGELLGLLDSVTPGDGLYTLKTAWFNDPLTSIRGITDRPQELLDIIVSFLGTPEPSLPGQDSSQQWHPIEYPSGGEPTGLYLITDGETSGEPGRVALGAKYKHGAGSESFSATVQLQLPLLDIASREVLLKPGKEPITLAVELGGGNEPFKANVPGLGHVSLDGLSLTAKLHIDNKAPEIDLLLRQFKVGTAAARNISLIEIAKEPGKLAGEALKTLVVGAIGAATKAASTDKNGGAEALQADFLWLLGLTDPSSDVPSLQWGKLAGTTFVSEWRRWFNSILNDPKKLKAWLHGVYCLTRGLDVTERTADRDTDLVGTGTAVDPFAVSIVGGDTEKPLVQLTLSAKPGKFTPGLRVVSSAINPSDEIDLTIEATARLGEIAFGEPPVSTFTLKPAFELAAKAEHKTGVLFTYTDDDATQSISPNEFAAGISLTQGAGGAQLVPFADFKEVDASGQLGKTKSLVDLVKEATDDFDPLNWLLGKLQDEEVWEHIFTQLLPADSGLSYQNRGIAFENVTSVGKTDPGQPVSLKLHTGVANEKGVAVGVDARTAIDRLALSLQAGLSFDDVTELDSPSFTFNASIGGQDNSPLPMPRILASLDAEGDFQLAVELPVKDALKPLRLSLVPFKGLEGFSIDDVWPVLEGAILDNESVKKWLESPVKDGVQGCTWASILTEWPLLQKVDGKYQFPKKDSKIDVDALEALRPVTLIEVALKQFLSSIDELQLLKIGENDGLYLTQDKRRHCYGVRLAVSDLVVAGGKGKPARGKPDAQPEGTTLTLQAGKWMSEENKDDNWLKRSWGDDTNPPAGGIHLDLIKIHNGKPVFSPGLKLVSVGVNVAGTAKKPLFDVKGYRVEGIESRLYLDTKDPSSSEVKDPISSKVKVGGGVRLNRAAIPLGPSAGADTGSKNPVASGLLSSGGSKATKGQVGDPVNPVFGVQVSYVNKFDPQILSDDPKAGGKVWIPVKKSFGPLYCRKVGLGFDDERRLLVGYDGAVALGPLGIDLMDLSVGIPLEHPQQFSDYTLGLGGLNLTFDGGPVEISGAFLESTLGDLVQYTGAAMIKTETFSITGLGSYSVVGGAPSLFVFAVLDKDLGGPAFFHVTALAAGFGFKRKLILPSIEQVKEFPLVKVIMEPDYIGKSTDPKVALEKLSAAIPPDPSAYWLAVGVRFRSFEQIETVALLSVAFGSEVTISVLGLSTLTMPSNLEKGQSPICYAELALRAEFNPAVGVLSVDARLTSNSYIFEKDCKLTGGFAFYTWFSGEHEGDFVVTLGGYHPRFIPPPHYPVVPRLKLDWIKGDIRITGELYFALTPSCLMAGGKLDAVYDKGWVKAWFVAYADFLICWKPFHYDIAIGVSIGASATVSVDLGLFTISKTFTFELGADLHVWGPPFAGTARITFYIVSFTVRFGDPGPNELMPIGWDEFTKTFLPNESSVCGVVFTGGLLQEYKREKDKKSIAIVNGKDLAFNIQSKVPCTAIDLKHTWTKQEQTGTKQEPLEWSKPTIGSDDNAGKLGVKPMFASDLESTLSVTLTADNGTKLNPEFFDTSVVRKGFPDALWGQGKPSLSEPTNKVLPKVPAGVAVVLSERGRQLQVRHSLPAMALAEFEFERIDNKTIPWTVTSEPTGISATGEEVTLSNTIWGDKNVNDARAGVLAALAGVTRHPLNEVSLPLTAARADTIFQSDPTFANLGQPLA